MKFRLVLLVAALAIPGAAAQPGSPADVQNIAHYQTYGTFGQAPGVKGPERATRAELWRTRILSLRREALDLQQQDGGTLTDEHRAMLQAKLDRINSQARAN